jgi:error-prone DNA polymerase
MGWGAPRLPWSELEARLRGEADGNDSPAWSRKRGAYLPPPTVRGRDPVAHAELHVHSAFSFLDGACQPEALVEEAARLGIETLGLTDHDGMYGVVRFAEAAREWGIGTVVGAELSLEVPDPDRPDRPGTRLPVLARDPDGYARLSRTIADAQLAGEKAAPRYLPLEELGERAGGRWLVLTGGCPSALVGALEAHGPAAARRELQRLVAAFGRSNVAVELVDHGDPLDGHRNDALAEMAVRERVTVIATNAVRYARPSDHRLAAALAAIRARRSLDELDGWLPVSAGAHLRSGSEQARRFRRYPGVIDATAALGRELASTCGWSPPTCPATRSPTATPR